MTTPRKPVSTSMDDIRVSLRVVIAKMKPGSSSAEIDNLVNELVDKLRENDVMSAVPAAPLMREGVRALKPTVGDIDGGPTMFHRGCVNTIFGSDNAGKTFLMQAVAIQEMRKGNNVIWVDYEEPDSKPAIERLVRMGIDPDIVERHLTLFVPDAFKTAHIDQLVQLSRDKKATLVVFDSFGEMLARAGRDENRDGDVGNMFNDIFRPIARQGAAVVLIDHVTKSTDGGWAAGSKRKRAGVDGAAFELENTNAFHKGASGASKIICRKSRHGAHERGAIVGWMEFDPSLDHEDDNGFLVIDTPLSIGLIAESRWDMADILDDDQPAFVPDTFEETLFRVMRSNKGPLHTSFIVNELSHKNVKTSKNAVDRFCEASDEFVKTGRGWQLAQDIISHSYE